MATPSLNCSYNPQLDSDGGQRDVLAPPAAEHNSIQMVQKQASIVIVIAATAMSTMALDPAEVITYLAAAPTFQSALCIFQVVMVFAWLVLSFLGLQLSGRENKRELIMRIQNSIGLAVAASLSIAMCASVLGGLTE